jgi:hypothetical protein
MNNIGRARTNLPIRRFFSSTRKAIRASIANGKIGASTMCANRTNTLTRAFWVPPHTRLSK